MGTTANPIGACFHGKIERCLPPPSHSLKMVTRQARCVVSKETGNKKRSVALSTGFCRKKKNSVVVCLSSSSQVKTTTKSGIEVIRNPPESKLAELGVRSWSKWGCPPSKFPWTYSSRETCYLLQGKVKVTADEEEAVEIGAGDLVVFPKGLSCTWDVSEAVDKHYKFD